MLSNTPTEKFEIFSDQTEITSLRKYFLDKIDNFATNSGETKTEIPGLAFYRYNNPSPPETHIQEPGICLIAQGAKKVILGDRTFQNDTKNYLLTLLNIPVVTEISQATKEQPYLALSLKLDLREISLMLPEIEINENAGFQRKKVEGKNSENKTVENKTAISATGTTVPLFKAFNKLLDLLDEPENIPMLAPLVLKEILYRLLISDLGPVLRQLTLSGSQSQRIVQTIEMLKKNFSNPLRIEDLAAESRMSKSTFHQHFRELTSMTPLQYQKWLRLQEARRLMLIEQMDAANAAFQVGYESPSQFSREYSRMFHSPPSKDIKQLRENLLT